MTFVEVDETTLPVAGRIHSESWQASHIGFCNPSFVRRHTPEHQTEYLRQEMAAGKRLFLLSDPEPLGIVTVQGSLIENLYVLPRFQRQGYGTALLEHAVSVCDGRPRLWILENNAAARALYTKHGFTFTGRTLQLSATLSEHEMAGPSPAPVR